MEGREENEMIFKPTVLNHMPAADSMNHNGLGLGGGLLGGLLLGGLLGGNRRNGLFGGGEDCGAGASALALSNLITSTGGSTKDAAVSAIGSNKDAMTSLVGDLKSSASQLITDYAIATSGKLCDLGTQIDRTSGLTNANINTSINALSKENTQFAFGVQKDIFGLQSAMIAGFGNTNHNMEMGFCKANSNIDSLRGETAVGFANVMSKIEVTSLKERNAALSDRLNLAESIALSEKTADKAAANVLAAFAPRPCINPCPAPSNGGGNFNDNTVVAIGNAVGNNLNNILLPIFNSISSSLKSLESKVK